MIFFHATDAKMNIYIFVPKITPQFHLKMHVTVVLINSINDVQNLL